MKKSTMIHHMATLAVGGREGWTVTVQTSDRQTVQVSYTHLESGRVVSDTFTAQEWRQAIREACRGVEILQACSAREALESATPAI